MCSDEKNNIEKNICQKKLLKKQVHKQIFGGFIGAPERMKTTQITKRHLMQLRMKLDNLKENEIMLNKYVMLIGRTKWQDEGSPVYIIYLDFQKPFDKVPHQRLLLKLEAHGIGDGIID